EGRSDDAFFQLAVLIIGVTGAQTYVLNARQRIAQFAAQIDPAALQADFGGGVVVVAFMVVPMVVVAVIVVVMAMIVAAAAVEVVAVRVAALIFVAVTGQAVAAGLFRIGRAQIAARADPGGAQSRRRGLIIGAVQARFVPARNLVIVRLARRRFDTEGEVSGPDRHADHAGFLIVDQAATIFGHDFSAFSRDAGRDLLVQQIDRAADGAAAIEQGRRTTQDLDAFQQQGLAADGVVGRDFGSVHQARAFAQHLDARRGLAAHHRAAGAPA